MRSSVLVILLFSSIAALAVEPVRTPATFGNQWPNADALMRGRSAAALYKNRAVIRAAAGVDQERAFVHSNIAVMRQLKADAARDAATTPASIDAKTMQLFNRHATPVEIDRTMASAKRGADQQSAERKAMLPTLRQSYRDLAAAKATLRSMTWSE